MAARTLPKRIADWIGFLSAGRLGSAESKHLPVIVLGMVLGSGRRTTTTSVAVHRWGTFPRPRSKDNLPSRKQRMDCPRRLKRLSGHHQGWTQARLTLRGVEQLVTFKAFLATYRPAGGVIRVVIVRRTEQLFAEGPVARAACFCTDPEVSVDTILEAGTDRAAIEQDFHDVKELHGSGRQQVRNVWCNAACWNLLPRPAVRLRDSLTHAPVLPQWPTELASLCPAIS